MKCLDRTFWIILHIIWRFFVFIFNFIWNLLIFIIGNCYFFYKKRRIKKINNHRRSIIEEKQVDVSNIFSNGFENRCIISGNTDIVRSDILETAIINDPGNPIILLHAGDNCIVQNNNLLQNSRLIQIDANNKIYDPFYNCSDDEIISFIADSFETNFTSEMSGYIKGMLLYIRLLNRKPTLRNMCSCPHTSLIDIINRKANTGKIQRKDADLITQNLTAGFSNYQIIDRYFKRMYNECQNIIMTGNYSNCYDIKRAVSENKILIFDIASPNNTLFLNFIFSQLKTINYNAKIILDNINIGANQNLIVNFLHHSQNNIIISSNDLYSMIFCNDQLFRSLIGSSKINIIMSHNNAASARKWSEEIGSYEKIEMSYNFGGRVHWGCTLAGLNEGLSTVNREMPRVQAIDIQNMEQNELYIMDSYNQNIVHANMD